MAGVQFYCPSHTYPAIPYCSIFSIFSYLIGFMIMMIYFFSYPTTIVYNSELQFFSLLIFSIVFFCIEKKEDIKNGYVLFTCMVKHLTKSEFISNLNYKKNTNLFKIKNFHFQGAEIITITSNEKLTRKVDL